MNNDSIAHLIDKGQSTQPDYIRFNTDQHKVEFLNGKTHELWSDEKTQTSFSCWLMQRDWMMVTYITNRFNGYHMIPPNCPVAKGNTWGGKTEMTFDETMEAIEFWNAVNPADDTQVPF